MKAAFLPDRGVVKVIGDGARDFLQLGDEQLVGASPEMFVRVEGNRVETCPIAGTARRTGDPLRDADNIVSRENEWDRRDLNRSWLRVARVVHGMQHFGREIECSEWHKARTVAR